MNLLKNIACLFRKKKVSYTKSQLNFQKELEEVKKQIQEVKDEMAAGVEEPNGNVAPVEEKVAFTGISAPNDKAYSIVFDSKLNKWLAVEVLFDYQAGTLGGMKVIESNPQKYIIIERFNVLVGKNLL
jgi:hypothetical protein